LPLSTEGKVKVKVVALAVAAVTVRTAPVPTFSTTITGLSVMRSKFRPTRVIVPETILLGEMVVSEGLAELAK
jgi:hypothetical protein